MKPTLLIGAILLFVLLQISHQNEATDDSEIFIPSHEWKTVKKGQKIPKGLHVRINFETGITEAKLLDENEQENKLSAVAIPQPIDQLDTIGKLQSKKERVEKPKFKSYEEIRQDLDDINLTPKTDAEVITGLIVDYKKDTSQEIVLNILEDLEYLAHQYDNALEFVRLNGFNEVIYKSLNSSSEEIKAKALILMGSLAQNNPKVQIHAVETNGLNVLQRILTDKGNFLKPKAVFALGGILRRFPYAQMKFIDNGGLISLVDAIKSDNLKLGLKVATLLSDLVHEYNQVISTTENKETLNQYEQVNIKQQLLQLEFCQSLNQLFINLIIIDKTDLDNIERCLYFMETISQDCKSFYIGKFRNILIKFAEDLQTLKDKDVSNILQIINNLLKNTIIKEEL